MKNDEEINQRTFMLNSQTQTTRWGLAWGEERVMLGQVGEGEKKWEQL